MVVYGAGGGVEGEARETSVGIEWGGLLEGLWL